MHEPAQGFRAEGRGSGPRPATASPSCSRIAAVAGIVEPSRPATGATDTIAPPSAAPVCQPAADVGRGDRGQASGRRLRAGRRRSRRSQVQLRVGEPDGAPVGEGRDREPRERRHGPLDVGIGREQLARLGEEREAHPGALEGVARGALAIGGERPVERLRALLRETHGELARRDSSSASGEANRKTTVPIVRPAGVQREHRDRAAGGRVGQRRRGALRVASRPLDGIVEEDRGAADDGVAQVGRAAEVEVGPAGDAWSRGSPGPR